VFTVRDGLQDSVSPGESGKRRAGQSPRHWSCSARRAQMENSILHCPDIKRSHRSATLARDYRSFIRSFRCRGACRDGKHFNRTDKRGASHV